MTELKFAARLLAVALLASGVVGCNDTQRPAPIYYGQPPGSGQQAYVPPAYPPASTYSQPAAPAWHAAPPAPAAPAYSAPPATVYSPPPAGGTAAAGQRIVIGRGETLYAISRRYQVPLRAIIDANRLKPPYRLVAGRTLILPQTTVALPPSEGSAQHPVATAPAASPPEASSPPERRSVATPPAAAPPAPAPDAATQTTPAPPLHGPEPTSAPAPPAASAPPPHHPETASIPSPRAGHGFLWPVQGRIIAHFGAGPNGTQNDGIDISAPEGTPVLAADSGVVAYAGNELRGYGNLVLVKHADGWMTAYGHNARILVKRGDRVQRGQVIAHVGSTGAVSEPQLHFELRKGTHALDPLDY